MFFLSVLLCSCSDSYETEINTSGGKQKTVSLVNWNVQTFFDGQKDGCEYSEFLKNAYWNNEKYSVRLERLANVIAKLDADIYVFEEIENKGIMQDLSNVLAGTTAWKTKDGWKYSCFSKPDESGIGIGILSKYELKNLSVHGLDVRVMKEKQPGMRYLIQVTADVNGEDLIILANHWKSMAGGETSSEVWRDWQESVLGGRLVELDGICSSVVVCGDFNRDLSKFVQAKNFDGIYDEDNSGVFFRYADFGNTKLVHVDSTWFDESGNLRGEIGSYYFRNKWERIDHVFLYGNVEAISFDVSAHAPWANEDKIPIAYKLSTGEGYSDHLPLICKLKFK